MRIVLDSNILLSALISPAGCPHQSYLAWQDKRFELVTAEIQLDEIRRASRYPKFRGILQPHRVGRILNNLRGTTIIDPLRVTSNLPRMARFIGSVELWLSRDAARSE